jgi:hypothetical protein
MRIAREAGAGEPESLYGRTDYVVMTQHELARFAELVIAAEREACAEIIEHNVAACKEGSLARSLLESNAKAIRARGKK